MGAYHDWRYAALRNARSGASSTDFLPLSIRPVIVWDGRLLCTPPALAVPDPGP